MHYQENDLKKRGSSLRQARIFGCGRRSRTFNLRRSKPNVLPVTPSRKLRTRRRGDVRRHAATSFGIVLDSGSVSGRVTGTRTQILALSGANTAYQAAALPVELCPVSQSWSGHWDSNPEPCANLAPIPLIRRLLFQLSYAP